MNFSTYTLIHKNWYFIFSTPFFIVQLESKCNIIISKAEKRPVNTHGFVWKTWRRSGCEESEVLNHRSRLATPHGHCRQTPISFPAKLTLKELTPWTMWGWVEATETSGCVGRHGWRPSSAISWVTGSTSLTPAYPVLITAMPTSSSEHYRKQRHTSSNQ